MAFVDLVKRYNPEVHTDRFLVIQSAYNRLKDPKRRAKEDLHTYNTIHGEFLFIPDERPDDGRIPSDEEISQCRDHFRKMAGDHQAKTHFIRMLMRRSHSSVNKKLWSEAIKDWSEVQQIDPTHVRARNNLMYAHIMLGLSYALHSLHEDAIELWEKALELNPDNVELVHNLALACEKSEQSNKAARYWAEVINRWKKRLDKEPENEYLRECIIEAHRYHGGNISQATTEEEKSVAINRYRQVLELRPDDFDAQFQIANSLAEERKHDEAVVEFNKLHAKHPRNVEVLNSLGWSLLNSGKVDQAFLAWNKSMSIDPKNPMTKENIVRAHLTLGKQYRQKGMFTPALVHLKKLLRYIQSPEVYMEIGATYDMKGDTRSAKQAYQQVLELDPKNKLARKALNDLRLKR